jgi:hypothetical protein
MKITSESCCYRLDASLIDLLNNELQRLCPDGNSDTPHDVTLHFKDASYSAEQGGFHPVEIMIRKSGSIAYITDFSYVGIGPYAELAKEIDFDFGLGVFGHMGRDYSIEAGKVLFRIWQENFVSYYEMGVYQVTCN